MVAISLILFFAVIAYMGYYIASAFTNRISTSEAVLATAEDTLMVNGWFARNEYGITLEGGADDTKAEEGEKVHKGQIVAVAYRSGGAQDMSLELAELNGRLERLQATETLVPGEDMAKVEKTVSEYLCGLAYAAASGNYSGAAGPAALLKAAVLQRDYVHGRFSEEVLQREISGLESRISVLSGRTSETVAEARAPSSGYYSSKADGYESVLTYDGVLEMTPSDLDNLAYLNVQPERDSCGKISTSFIWRYAAAVTDEQAAALEEGKWYTLRFSGDYVGEVYSRLYQIGDSHEGRRVLIFSGSRNFGDLLAMRRQTAEIVIRSYEGIRVPKSAIRIGENGQNGVYILLAAQARFVPVEQIYEAEGYYIVIYDSASGSALRPGDEIIVSAKELYNGKVVE